MIYQKILAYKITLSLELGVLIPGPELWETVEGGAPGPNDIRGSDPLGGGKLPAPPNEAGKSSLGGPGGRPGIPGGSPPGN